MELIKVSEILNEFVNKKFNGSLTVDFRKGEPYSISKSQKVLFDPYSPKQPVQAVQGSEAVRNPLGGHGE